MWDSLLVQHDSIDSIMSDKGLAQIGDNLVNFFYSLAKSVVLECMSGEKVRDKVLAKAIRATALYQHIGRRTDAGRAADAYEAIIAWLWMKGKLDADWAITHLAENLKIEKTTNRKQEGEIAAEAFRLLLEMIADRLPM
ncbi:MAG: ribonuclease III family protein [Candidatus Thorarchaeota archaeon]